VLLKKLETTKLFWDKYLYKLCINNGIGSIFRDKNLSYVRGVLDKLQQQYDSGNPLVIENYYRQIPVKELSFLDARKLYKFLSKTDDYMLRIESSTVAIYSNNREWLHTLKSAINKDNLLELWEPNPDHLSTLDSNTIIVDKSNGYDFKVTFGPKVADTSGFANWAKNNVKQVRVGPTLMENLERSGYVSDLYFYARDEKTLRLCELMLSNIRRIDKLVVKTDLDK
jgi:hypothetical protein